MLEFPSLGGVQGMSGHGTQCLGLVDTVGISHSLDSMTLEFFPSLIDPVILCLRVSPPQFFFFP